MIALAEVKVNQRGDGIWSFIPVNLHKHLMSQVRESSDAVNRHFQRHLARLCLQKTWLRRYHAEIDYQLPKN
jgi:hypothetical protein